MLLALVAGAVAAAGASLLWARSDARFGVGKPAEQPIDFRHDLHAGELGIACRYCHVSATNAAGAGMPPVATCLTCHSQIWRGTRDLAPLHAAAAKRAPIRWGSVGRLAAHARFHHGAHAAAGVPCATCHGAVETMRDTVKVNSFSMGWCVDCHRDPAGGGARVRTASAAGRAHADGRNLTDCAVCHY